MLPWPHAKREAWKQKLKEQGRANSSRKDMKGAAPGPEAQGLQVNPF